MASLKRAVHFLVRFAAALVLRTLKISLTDVAFSSFRVPPIESIKNDFGRGRPQFLKLPTPRGAGAVLGSNYSTFRAKAEAFISELLSATAAKLRSLICITASRITKI